MVLKWSLYDH